jgi:cell wall-active antibiotic response 4TMS protein YvqF
MSSRRYRRHRDTLVWGLVLIGLGVTFLLTNSGVWPNDTLRHWWPMFVVISGLGSLVGARGARGVGSAVTTAAMGVWLLVATNDWYGLGWSRSWPLAIVAIGLGTLTEAIVARFWRDEVEEGTHGS